MAIDKSGKWWIGSRAKDTAEYLDAFSEASYRVHEFRLAQCDCGSTEFILDASDNDGVARRTCAHCKNEHFICDSKEYWDAVEPELTRFEPVREDCKRTQLDFESSCLLFRHPTGADRNVKAWASTPLVASTRKSPAGCHQ